MRINIQKRLIPLLCCLVLVCYCMPLGASAESTDIGFDIDDSTNAVANQYWKTVDLYSLANSGSKGTMYVAVSESYFGLYFSGDGYQLSYCFASNLGNYISGNYPLGVICTDVGYSSRVSFALYQNHDYAYNAWASYTSKTNIYFLTQDSYLSLTTDYGTYIFTFNDVGVIDEKGIVSYGQTMKCCPRGTSVICGLYPVGYGSTDSGDDDSSIVSIIVSGPDTVELGSTAQYQANVYGSGDYDTAVTWSMSGLDTASGTSIDENGLLTVAENETASWVTIRATSVQDPTISGALTVTVTSASEDTTEPTEVTDPSESTLPPDETEGMEGEPAETTVSVSDNIINGGTDPGSEELNSNIQTGVEDMENAMDDVGQVTLPSEDIGTSIEDLVDEESSSAVSEFLGRLTGNALVTTQFAIACALTHASYLLFGKKK